MRNQIFQSIKNKGLFFLCAAILFGCNTKQAKSEAIEMDNQAKVQLKKEEGKFKLYVNKKPFYIHRL